MGVAGCQLSQDIVVEITAHSVPHTVVGPRMHLRIENQIHSAHMVAMQSPEIMPQTAAERIRKMLILPDMTDILDEMTSVEITHAVKDAEADGFEVKTGDIIALSGNIIARGNDVDDVVLDVLKKYSPDDICVVDLYYGACVTEDAAASLTEKVEELLPDCDIRCINGGQPHYDYFISIA